MGLPDSMGALTDYHKRFKGFCSLSTPSKSPFERRTGTRLVSQRFESRDEEDCSSRKRTRTLIGSPQKYHLQFAEDIFPPRETIGNSTNLFARPSKTPADYSENSIFSSSPVSKLDLIPPPRPLSRSLQGPQRSWMGSTPKRFCDRVSKEEGGFVPSELGNKFNDTPKSWYAKRGETVGVGLADSVDFDALERYRRLVASLQQCSVVSPRRTNNDIDNGSDDDDDNNQKGTLSEEDSQQEDAVRAGYPSSSAIVAHGALNFPPPNIHSGREIMIAAGGGREDAKPGNERPLYLHLHQKASERDIILKALELEVQLTTTKLEALQFTKRERFQSKEKETTKEKLFISKEVSQKKEKKAAKKKLAALHHVFAPLKEDEEADVSRALHGQNRREVLVMHENSNIEITREILQCLLPSAWLNDEVINLYLELLKEREKREPRKFLKCHFFNTFFYKKLFNSKNNYDYKAVRRWTTQKKIGYSLIDCEKIFVPIHKEIHWCLAIIDMRGKKFQYLDSLKGSDAHVLKVLARYIMDEAKDKSGKDLDVSSWEQEYVEDLPEQENGWDCGMFMVKYADFHSQDLPLSFCQANMPYFRKRTAKEILKLRAE